jgi:spermidine synthase
MNLTFREPWGSSTYECILGTYKSFYTQRQEVDIFTNPFYGRMLFLDGVLQSTSSDEKIYHEALVSFGFPTHTRPARFLVAGGSEGCCLREILETACNVKEVCMVDWDSQLVRYMKETEKWDKGAFNSPLVKVFYEDIHRYLLRDSSIYDSIILDLLDPVSTGDIEKLVDCCLLALKNLASDGKLVMNAGGCSSTVDTIIQKVYEKTERPVHSTRKVIHVPSFQQPWYLICIRAC